MTGLVRGESNCLLRIRKIIYYTDKYTRNTDIKKLIQLLVKQILVSNDF